MKWILRLAVLGLIILGIWLWPPGTWMISNCQLDGDFSDWQGKSFLTDPEGDGINEQDVKALFWNTNENEQKMYFMLERYSAKEQMGEFVCRLYFDINNNGSYQDRIDKYAEVSYQPVSGEEGRVKVELISVTGSLIETYSGNWGEGLKGGGRRFEFYLPMDELQVYAAQPIAFHIAGIGPQADRLPDKGDIQWAPFPVNIKSRITIAVVCVIWLVVTLYFYRRRIWVFYYMWGAVGFSCVLILLFRGSLVEYQLEHYTSLLLQYILNYFNVVTYVFDKAPGTLLVLIQIDNSWTTISIDIENSGFLEICICFGLTLFYPVYNIYKKIFIALSGGALIYFINFVRLVIVILVVHSGGRDMTFIANTLIGRLIFFVLVIALYWHLLTKPTLKKIRENVNNV